MGVPTNLIPTPITGLQEYTGSSTLGYLPYVLEGRTYKVQFANIAAVGAVPSTRVIAAGTGLAGGGDLSANRVISIAAGGVGFDQLALSGVIAGTYGSGSAIPILTVDAKGRVTSATTAALDVTGFVPTSRTITAGDGLTGGGSLANNITLGANFSVVSPSALGIASPGTAVTLSRGDHVHPAVNLSDTTQTQGALPLGRGGTGDALSPVAGAVVYSTGTKFALTNPGIAGQVLVSAGTDEPQWQTIEGAGTVTSVNASGGTTGLSFTGGPITVSGTLTLGGTLGVSNGGTGATDAATALSNLGAYPASNPAGYTSNVGTVTSVSGTGTVSGLSLSGTVTSAGSLTLGGTLVVTASNFASQSANTVLAAPNGSAGTPTFRAIVAADIPTLNQNTTGTASNVTGIVAVANGGTGASIAGTARTNLSAAASGANTDITSIALTTGTISASPVNGTDIVNKLYADSIASGINFHQSVRLATVAALPANTYNNGASGVGATLTANANGALSVDGVAVVAGNRILVKNEAAGANNGVYTVTQVGDGSTPYILTRATDFDSAGTGVDQIDAGDFFLVTAGSTQANTSWVQQTPLPITVGTTAIVFSQFAAPVLYTAGTGLTLAGTVFSITNTGVAASTYGSASSVPVLAINAQGQVTSASSSSIAINASQITTGTVTVAQGGTGATTLGANGVLLGNGTSAISATAVGTTGQVLVGNTGGAPSWATLSGIGVTSFSAGTTGLTPASATTGAITLAGTLNVANGGTGATTLTSGYLVKGNGTSAVSASVVYDNGTNVGIGTASPLTKLNVEGGSFLLRGGAIDIGPTAGADGAGRISTVRGGDGVSGNLIFSTQNSSASMVEAMRIDGSGNVGIGTSSPATKLDVNGDATFRNGSGVIIGTVANSSGWYDFAGSVNVNGAQISTPNATPVRFLTNATERMRIDTSGNVGIGVTPAAHGSSERSLDIGNTTSFGRQSDAALVANFNSFLNASSQYIYRISSFASSYQQLAGQHKWFNAPSGTAGNAISFTQAMTLDASGNLGVGTATPNARLSLFSATGSTNGITLAASGWAYFGRIGMNGTSGGEQYWTANYSFATSAVDSAGEFSTYIQNSAGQGIVAFGTSSAVNTAPTERMRINAAGNVGIGTSGPLSRLDVREANRADSTNIANVGVYTTTAQSTGVGGTLALGGLFNGSDLAPFASIRGGKQNSINNNYDGYLALQTIANGGVLTERLRIDSTGKVGIGSNNPTELLTINGVGANAGYPLITFNDQGTNRGQIGYTFDFGYFHVSSASTLAFRTAGSERMRLNTSGNLLVGTSGDYGGRLSLVPATNPTTASGANQISIGESSSNAAYRLNVGYMLVSGSYFAGSIQSIAGSTGAPLVLNGDGGNVGIGTNAPTKKLHLFSDNDLAAVRFTNTANAKVWDLTPAIPGVANSGFSLYNVTDNTVPLHVTNGGNVGIGTTSPYNKLETADSGGATIGISNTLSGADILYGKLAFYSTVGAGGYKEYGGQIRSYSGIGIDYGDLRLYTANGAVAAERMRITNAGDVVIGNTAAPYTTTGRRVFNVNGTSSTILSLQTAGSNRGYLYGDGSLISLEAESGCTLSLRAIGAQPMTFFTSNTERMRIDSSGFVGIGTTFPEAHLTVSGGANSTSGAMISIYETSTGNDARLRIVQDVGAAYYDATYGSGTNQHIWKIGGTERARISSAGYLEFPNSTFTRPGSTGQYIVGAANGGFYQQDGANYYLVTTTGGSTSDATLKKDVQQLDGALQKICAVRGVTFEFIETPLATSDCGTQIGVIAQEIEAQFPEIVVTHENGTKAVRYDRLVAPLIEAIKELTARVAQLEGK